MFESWGAAGGSLFSPVCLSQQVGPSTLEAFVVLEVKQSEPASEAAPDRLSDLERAGTGHLPAPRMGGISVHCLIDPYTSRLTPGGAGCYRIEAR